MKDLVADLLDHTQAWCILHSAWRGRVEDLAAAVCKSMPTDRNADVRRLLLDADVQAALRLRDVLLWRGGDKLLRLVDASASSRRRAQARTQHHPGEGVCRFCLLSEGPAPLTPELKKELSSTGEEIPGSFLHDACAPFWKKLKNQAEIEHV